MTRRRAMKEKRQMKQTVGCTIELPVSLRRRGGIRAAMLGLSFTAYVRRLLTEDMTRHEVPMPIGEEEMGDCQHDGDEGPGSMASEVE